MPFVYAHGSPFAGTSADRNATLSAAGNTTGAPRRLHACTSVFSPYSRRSASSLRQAGARLNKAVSHAPGGVFCIPHAPASSAASSMPYALSR